MSEAQRDDDYDHGFQDGLKAASDDLLEQSRPVEAKAEAGDMRKALGEALEELVENSEPVTKRDIEHILDITRPAPAANTEGLREALIEWLDKMNPDDLYRGWFLRSLLRGMVDDPAAWQKFDAALRGEGA